MLYSRDWYNIVNQLYYFNKKKLNIKRKAELPVEGDTENEWQN